MRILKSSGISEIHVGHEFGGMISDGSLDVCINLPCVNGIVRILYILSQLWHWRQGEGVEEMQCSSF